MKITLVNPTPPDACSFGVRSLSAFLKQNGIDVRCVFLPGGVKKFRFNQGYVYGYEDHILEQVVELCRDADLVGFSLMTNYFDRAVQVTQAVRDKLTVPIIWGGIHPTVAPEESLEYADIVCRGEGEDATLELLRRLEAGKDYADVPNLWVRNNGTITRNTIRGPIADLNALPFADFGLEDHYAFDILTDAVEPMSKELLQRSFPLEPNLEGTFSDHFKRTLSFKIMGTRGCPHHCAFCAEKALTDLYKDEQQCHYYRKRSIDHILAELSQIRQEMPFVESIFMFDDTFTARSTSEIVEFSKRYKEEVGLPFHVQASPTTLNAEKMTAMIDGGLAFIEMGIQTVSERGIASYNRKSDKDLLLDRVKLMHEHTKQIYSPCYHVILDNPWETSADVIETVKFILKFPPPFWLKRASLVMYPGTDVNVRAKKEGLIASKDEERRQVYQKHMQMPSFTYPNMLMYMAGFSRFPRFIIRFFTHRIFVKAFDRRMFAPLYKLFYKGMEMAIVLSKGLRSVLKGDFARIRRYVEHWYT